LEVIQGESISLPITLEKVDIFIQRVQKTRKVGSQKKKNPFLFATPPSLYRCI